MDPGSSSSGEFDSETAADSPRGSDLTEDALEYARALLVSSREELVRADTKAALLLAASGIAIGALLNGLLGGKWSPSDLNSWVEWLWWLGIASTVVAIVSLASAIYPRTKRFGVKPSLVAYYGDVVLLSREELAATIMAATPAKINSALFDQIYQVSLIVSRKYKLFRIALWAFASAAALCAASVLINALISA